MKRVRYNSDSEMLFDLNNISIQLSLKIKCLVKNKLNNK